MPRRHSKKTNRRRRVNRKPRMYRSVRNVSEYASLSESRTLVAQAGGSITNNDMYSILNTSLSQFTRATTVARAYQHFRIKYITLTFKPTFDTYAAGAAQPLSKPNLYYMIDRAGAIPDNITLEGLKKMGAKPRAFDEKPIKIGWRPSVLQVDMTAGGAGYLAQPSQYKISPWLNTNAVSVDPAAWAPSTVDHLGCYWYVDVSFQGGDPQPYMVDCEVQFEFKKPLFTDSTGQTSAKAVGPATLNASKDGIVDVRPGGDDTLLTH